MPEEREAPHPCGGPEGGRGSNPGCGELIEFDDFGMFAVEAGEVGEFWDEAAGTSWVMHAQCGIDAGLPLA